MAPPRPPHPLNLAGALIDEANALRRAGDLAGAQARFEAAVAAAPDAAPPIHNLATLRHMVGDLAGAEAGYRRALALEPDNALTATGLGAVLLAQGRFTEGFPLYDQWRRAPGRAVQAAPDLSLPRWRGEPLAGKRLLIWSEEGFGDQIMFARYAARLRDLGAQITWLCPPPLARLFAEGLGVVTIPAAGAVDIRLDAFDLYSPSSALPLLFDGEVSGAPYLRPPAPRSAPGLTLGMIVNGNPNHPHDTARSIPEALRPDFLALPGAVSLQPEVTGARDFHDTAAIIMGLDLVISVDTAVAHLAGALGKPVWVLAYAPEGDWRWMQGRTDSPWYDSARVFRQAEPGDWSGVLSDLQAALAATK
jgi:hypothetical protein